jgi:hypothetical protein
VSGNGRSAAAGAGAGLSPESRLQEASANKKDAARHNKIRKFMAVRPYVIGEKFDAENNKPNVLIRRRNHNIHHGQKIKVKIL